MEEFSEAIKHALGDWKIVRLLGTGQYGKVYEIERMDFGTVYRAALKMVTIPQSEEEFQEIKATGMNDTEISRYFKSAVEDFVREFALMAQLKGHTNIVSYEDHRVIPAENGIGWTVLIRMELLTSLTKYVAEKQMTRRDVMKLGIDICKALELCQKVNVIHRDIKPANIFVSRMGEYKLGDFGVARMIENTMSGRTGTDTYMAPEVYYEEKYGPSADIYSLGIVLYRLLNFNRAPFLPAYPHTVTYRDNAEAFRRRINGEELPDPAQADGRLVEIVLKACAYRTADRYSSPVAMRKDLEAILYEKGEAEAIYPKGDEVSARDELSTNGTVSLKERKRGSIPGRRYHVRDQVEEGQDRPKEPSGETESPEEKKDVPEGTEILKKTESEAVSEEKKCVQEEKDQSENLRGKVLKEEPENGGIDYHGDETMTLRKKIRREMAKKDTESERPEKEKNASDAKKEPEEKAEESQKTLLKEEPEEKTEKISKSDIEKKETEQSEPEEKKSGKKKAVPILLSVAAIGIAAVFFAGQSRKTAVVPDICGEAFAKAKAVMQEAGFTVEVKNVYSDTVEKDVIISQDAAGGEKREKGSVITVTVSAGEKMFPIPDVLSKTGEEAKKELEGLGLTVSVREEYSSSKEGTVAAQSMEGGTAAKKGQEITLTVSKQRPEMKGKTLEEAVELLKQEGFRLAKLKQKSSSKAEPGRILGVKYQIAEERTAALTINCIRTPDVSEMKEEDALEMLKQAGFREEDIEREEEYNGDIEAGRVCEYSVTDSGESLLFGVPEETEISATDGLVFPGAKIRITISKGAKPQPVRDSGTSSSYTPPSNPVQPQQPSNPAPSYEPDEGFVISDGDAHFVN